MKDKYIESWIYNKNIGMRSPKYSKDQGVESWILRVDKGIEFSIYYDTKMHVIGMWNPYYPEEKYHSWAGQG